MAELSPLFDWRGAIQMPGNGLSATQKHVALGLSLYMSSRGYAAWPGVPTLAADCALGTSTVREALRVLRELGWLTEKQRPGATTIYTAEVPLQQLEAYRNQHSVAPTPPAAGATPPAAGAELEVQDTKAMQVTSLAAARPRDLLWDVFDEELGPVTNDTERGRRNRELKYVRQSLGLARGEAATAYHAAELRGRINRARNTWAGKSITEHAIAVNWRLLGSDEGAATLSLDDMARQAYS